MSTRCKLDPMVRIQRRRRAQLLRNPQPRLSDKGVAVMTELALIAASSRLHGNTKHALFLRGAHQLAALTL
jgi:hypothetical protein